MKFWIKLQFYLENTEWSEGFDIFKFVRYYIESLKMLKINFWSSEALEEPNISKLTQQNTRYIRNHSTNHYQFRFLHSQEIRIMIFNSCASSYGFFERYERWLEKFSYFLVFYPSKRFSKTFFSIRWIGASTTSTLSNLHCCCIVTKIYTKRFHGSSNFPLKCYFFSHNFKANCWILLIFVFQKVSDVQFKFNISVHLRLWFWV